MIYIFVWWILREITHTIKLPMVCATMLEISSTMVFEHSCFQNIVQRLNFQSYYILENTHNCVPCLWGSPRLLDAWVPVITVYTCITESYELVMLLTFLYSKIGYACCSKTCFEILTRNRDVKWMKVKCWIYYNFPEVFRVF